MKKIYCLKDKIHTLNLFETIKIAKNGNYYIQAFCAICKSKKNCFISKQNYFKTQKQKQREKDKENFDIGLSLARNSRKIRNRVFKRKNSFIYQLNNVHTHN